MQGSAHALTRFWGKVQQSESGCWRWLGVIGNNGYGVFAAGRRFRMTAHRLAFTLASSREIPVGLCVCHSCDNKWCVNPSHLFLGTIRDNANDMIAKGRQNFAGARFQRAKTHCCHGHAYTPENTMRRGPLKQWRACRECNRLWLRTTRRAATLPSQRGLRP